VGFGQYSDAYKGRRTKDELLRSCKPGYLCAQLWGHNRLFVLYKDRSEYRLHDTPVVTKHENGDLVIDDGGWPTLTTTAAIKQALSLATGGRPCNAWRAGKGKLYVCIGDFAFTAALPIRVSHVVRED